mmetsp:Transcript_14043/g.39721  ORF Transcript_14043/g.39721 Transcript_14043/m.39721 type:complete len:206 (-) Transcript_14043:129-746(-)
MQFRQAQAVRPVRTGRGRSLDAPRDRDKEGLGRLGSLGLLSLCRHLHCNLVVRFPLQGRVRYEVVRGIPATYRQVVLLHPPLPEQRLHKSAKVFVLGVKQDAGRVHVEPVQHVGIGLALPRSSLPPHVTNRSVDHGVPLEPVPRRRPHERRFVRAKPVLVLVNHVQALVIRNERLGADVELQQLIKPLLAERQTLPHNFDPLRQR